MAQAIRSPRYYGTRIAEAQHITRSDLFPHPRHFRGRHHAAAILVLALLAVFGFRLFPTMHVTVINDGEAFQVRATFDPQSEGLAAAEISLQPGDQVLQAQGGNYSGIAVQRARPVTVDVDGSLAAVRTRATTVGGVLAAAGIVLQPADSVYLNGRLTTTRGPLQAASRPPGAAAAATAQAPLQLTIVRAKPVTVVIDTLRVEISSSAPTVDQLLQQLGMTVREGDLVRPGLGDTVTSGMTIRLAKARTVTVRLDGVEQNLYTQAQTVADILTLLGVQPGPGDIIEPATDSYVVSGMTLIIALTRVVEEEASEAVAAGVVNETDLSLAEGSVRIIPGTDGLRLNRYRVTYKNGVEVAREPLPGGGITVPPVPTRHITGAKTGHPRAVLNTPEFTRPYSRSLTVRATWYNALGGGKFPGDPAYGLTRTGVMLDYGICAVDPAVIPLGTRFHVPGYGDCLAADTGGAIQGNIIDLGYPDSAGDPGWGVQTVTIYILD